MDDCLLKLVFDERHYKKLSLRQHCVMAQQRWQCPFQYWMLSAPHIFRQVSKVEMLIARLDIFRSKHCDIHFAKYFPESISRLCCLTSPNLKHISSSPPFNEISFLPVCVYWTTLAVWFVCLWREWKNTVSLFFQCECFGMFEFRCFLVCRALLFSFVGWLYAYIA